MKISVLSIPLLAAGLLFSGCNRFGCVEGSGRQISSNRTVAPFTFIETGGSVKLILKQGPQTLKILADDNIMEKIRTRVHGNTLTIDMDGNFCNSGPIVVYLSAKSYEGIEASGAVEIVTDGKLQVKDFEMDLSGSSKVDIDLNAANVLTRSSGSSEIAIKGQASTHEVDLSGSASVKALDFVVGRYRIESSGASECKINVLNELSVKSSGASDVEYRGNPSKVHNDESGASSLRKVN